MKCKKCKNKINKGENFCSMCGSEIVRNSKNAKSKKIIALVCCVAIILSGTIGGLFFYNKKSKSTLDIDGNYNCFTEGFTDVLVTDEKSAIEAVASVGDALGVKDAEKELKIVSVNSVSTDKYYRMQQYYKDIPVYGRTIVLSADNDSNATALTSNFISIVDDIPLKSTVTQEELNRTLQKYFNNDNVSFSVDDANLVLYQNEDGSIVLCYEIIVLSKRIMMDANTAKILLSTDLYVQDMVECEYKDGTFQGMKISDDNFQIGDDEKGIFVFNANYNPVIKSEVNDGKTTFSSVPENSLPMTSTDNYFGNNDSFSPEEYSKAIYMLNTLQRISHYYEELNINQNTSVIVTINDSFASDNAFGGYDDIKNATIATVPYEKDRIIAIFFGQDLCNDIYGHLDTLGHEYMHGINHNYFKSDKDEASAIDEAYADIFGELLESLIKNQSPNWIHGQRNMVNPHEYDNAKHPYPASINELKNAKTFKDGNGALWYSTTANSGTDFSHFASTIISHCAYLMWNGIDGTAERKIQQPELGELWYDSLLYLQDNADFKQCRNAVELAARNMMKKKQITEEQYKTVKTAFDMVGIENATFTYTETVKNKFDLSVLSGDGTENVNFKLEVIKTPEIKAGPGINNEMPKVVMEKSVLSGQQSLELEDGIYVLRITDLDEKQNNTRPINIKIIVKGDGNNTTDKVVVHTDFTDIITVELDNTEPTENTTTTIPNETTNADIPEAEAIAAFERMLKDSDAIWGWNIYEGFDSHQFASMSNSEIIEKWIACDGTPLGVYEVFSPDGSNGIKYTNEPNEENSYSDPERKFWCSYELDANLVDWILKNVFGKEPDRSLSSDNMYYSGNKVYVHSELGGGPGYLYKISDYEKLSDGKYNIYVEATYEADVGVPDTYLKFTATPKQDVEKGIYWQIHSYEGQKTTANSSSEIDEASETPIDVSKCYDLTFYEFAEKFNMTVGEGPGGCNAYGTSENLYRRGEYASFYSISLHSSLEDKNTKGAFQTSIISEKYSFYGVQIGMNFAECTSILKNKGFTLDESKTWNVDNSYFYYFYNSQGDQIQLNIYDDNCDGIDFYPDVK